MKNHLAIIILLACPPLAMADNFAECLLDKLPGVRALSERLVRLTCCALMFFSCQAIAAQSLNLDEIALDTVQQVNANPPPLEPGMLSYRAYADRHTVIYESVLSMRKNISESDLSAWRAEVAKELIPQACEVHRNNPALKQGMQYTYLYLDQSNKHIGEFVVTDTVCAGLSSSLFDDLR
ncbi:hypothetical protein [uncultured Pseudomonas sp.]|uniref:hypothetical protein n=1 Tax=uncultured Pseudomonas sp. TaxID=114707 RepID=UPI0030DA7AB9|tara:strand:- start:39256 stop:39795 length:540 start_codon:yes stop_codon:yes gene_type:complete